MKYKQIRKPYAKFSLIIIFIIFCVPLYAQVSATIIIKKGVVEVDGSAVNNQQNFKANSRFSVLPERWQIQATPNMPAQLKEGFLALFFDQQEIITLAAGSNLQKVGEKNYQISGVAHLLLSSEFEDEPMLFTINGHPFSTTGGYFFYEDLSKNPSLTLVDGQLSFWPKAGQAEKYLVNLDPGQTLSLTPPLKPIPNQTEKLVEASQVVGFSSYGNYRFIGVANFDKHGWQLTRNGQTQWVEWQRFPIALGDVVQTQKDTQVLIDWYSGSQIYLQASTSYKVAQLLKPKSKLESTVLLLIGALRAHLPAKLNNIKTLPHVYTVPFKTEKPEHNIHQANAPTKQETNMHLTTASH